MRHWFLAIALFTVTSSAHAQRIKVRKVKGNQAVVEASGIVLQPGGSYELISPEELGGDSTSNGRKYLIGLSFNISNTKSNATGAVNVTNIDLNSRFGWNFGNFELGPVISYNSKIATTNATTYKLGAFGDFNIITNISGEAFIYGLGGILAFGQHDPGSTAINDDYKYDLLDAFAGPFVKWFPTGGPYGFRVDAGYLYERQSTSTIGTVTISGFSSSLGIFAYF